MYVCARARAHTHTHTHTQGVEGEHKAAGFDGGVAAWSALGKRFEMANAMSDSNDLFTVPPSPGGTSAPVWRQNLCLSLSLCLPLSLALSLSLSLSLPLFLS